MRLRNPPYKDWTNWGFWLVCHVVDTSASFTSVSFQDVGRSRYSSDFVNTVAEHSVFPFAESLKAGGLLYPPHISQGCPCSCASISKSQRLPSDRAVTFVIFAFG